MGEVSGEAVDGFEHHMIALGRLRDSIDDSMDETSEGFVLKCFNRCTFNI